MEVTTTRSNPIVQIGTIFYLLSFGMIVPWRLAMVGNYLRLQKLEA
ncbi:CcdC protein domain-containing protein [Paenibacillus sp. NPDC057967]